MNNDIIILTIEIYIAGVKNRAGFATALEMHIPGQDGDLRKHTGSLANFIVQNHTFNAQMSLL